jgi:hypothetical protein
VWGHYFVAHLIIIVPIVVFAFCAGAMGGRR